MQPNSLCDCLSFPLSILGYSYGVESYAKQKEEAEVEQNMADASGAACVSLVMQCL